MGNNKWLDWAIELQALAQSGLFYSKDRFDIERFERIREISAEMMSTKTGLDMETVRNLFCAESGYQTPKLDSRAAVFRDGKILLVRENDGRWSLPGGWVDVNLSVGENAVKEAKEEAGVDVTADSIIAVQDRKKHNTPVYAVNICKVFVLCTYLGGEFCENSETTASGYFSLDELPELSEEKNTAEQIAMCFEAFKNPDRKTVFD
ncbi:MAG: NUDIX hydrolase [Clostridia bacterium]|nr:NUDIX hydrolase [Clostridia bacterium]